MAQSHRRTEARLVRPDLTVKHQRPGLRFPSNHTVNMMGMGRKLSVARELLLLVGSVDALRMAAERAKDSARPHGSFVYAMVGGLMILRDRLRLVEQVVIGAANPGVILCGANEADDAEDGPGIVPEWTPDDEVQRLKAELHGATYRRDMTRQEPQPPLPQKPDPKRSN
jgi:hypothetical protein